jgi:hypothetical protein
MNDAVQQLVAIERSRLKAFVVGDWDLADILHAQDFELVNPFGATVGKEDYLDPMREGSFRYLVWEPEGEVRARVVGDAGALRYRSQLSVRIGEFVLPQAPYLHTDYYEKRDGRWQVVFSQATPVEQHPADAD